jgi:hypothetical protein
LTAIAVNLAPKNPLTGSRGRVFGGFISYYEDKEWKPNAEAVNPFQEILRKIINLDCQIEIIGYWIYYFNSKEVREQLKEFGFWFSGKHKAWQYPHHSVNPLHWKSSGNFHPALRQCISR